ncbi:MAG: HPF/RaiA family ribosome-associated protein [Kofleriaceae bacterium]
MRPKARKQPRFAASLPKASKAERGRTVTQDTPIAVRSQISLSDRFENQIRTELASRIGHAASLIERGTVRFEDVNGPKGGVDTICRIKLVMSGRPSLVVEERSEEPESAFALAVPKLARVLERTRGKHQLSTGRHRANRQGRPASPPARLEDAGEIIGRRVGRGKAALARALERPEKERGDAYVDTAQPGVSASDRRAGGGITARRNSRAKHPKATAALEDSRTKPSRKSTRRSANRGKPSQGKERTALARSVTPSARAARLSGRH